MFTELLKADDKFAAQVNADLGRLYRLRRISTELEDEAWIQFGSRLYLPPGALLGETA